MALIEYPLSDEEIIVYTLNSLENEYNELMAAIRVYDSPLSFEELSSKLIDNKMYLKWEERETSPTIIAQFNQEFT